MPITFNSTPTTFALNPMFSDGTFTAFTFTKVAAIGPVGPTVSQLQTAIQIGRI